MMCAGYPGTSLCNGDSGGGLCYGGTLFGIASWGGPSCSAQYPSVYCSVAQQRPWIKSVCGF